MKAMVMSHKQTILGLVVLTLASLTSACNKGGGGGAATTSASSARAAYDLCVQRLSAQGQQYYCNNVGQESGLCSLSQYTSNTCSLSGNVNYGHTNHNPQYQYTGAQIQNISIDQYFNSYLAVADQSRVSNMINQWNAMANNQVNQTAYPYGTNTNGTNYNYGTNTYPTTYQYPTQTWGYQYPTNNTGFYGGFFGGGNIQVGFGTNCYPGFGGGQYCF